MDVESHPDFAIIWSFFSKFGKQLEMEDIMITDVVRWISGQPNQMSAVIDVMVKLMRKTGMRVDKQRWQKHLMKVAAKHDFAMAAELQTGGFHCLTVAKKLKILKWLCEMQFDDNMKFKAVINNEEADEQRLKPVGRDDDGLVYWHQEDGDLNIRLYVEDEDEDDETGWKVVCRTKEDIADLIKKLMDEPADKAKDENSDEEEEDIVETKFQKFLKTQCTSESNDDKDADEFSIFKKEVAEPEEDKNEEREKNEELVAVKIAIKTEERDINSENDQDNPLIVKMEIDSEVFYNENRPDIVCDIATDKEAPDSKVNESIASVKIERQHKIAHTGGEIGVSASKSHDKKVEELPLESDFGVQIAMENERKSNEEGLYAEVREVLDSTIKVLADRERTQRAANDGTSHTFADNKTMQGEERVTSGHTVEDILSIKHSNSQDVTSTLDYLCKFDTEQKVSEVAAQHDLEAETITPGFVPGVTNTTSVVRGKTQFSEVQETVKSEEEICSDAKSNKSEITVGLAEAKVEKDHKCDTTESERSSPVIEPSTISDKLGGGAANQDPEADGAAEDGETHGKDAKISEKDGTAEVADCKDVSNFSRRDHEKTDNVKTETSEMGQVHSAESHTSDFADDEKVIARPVSVITSISHKSELPVQYAADEESFASGEKVDSDLRKENLVANTQASENLSDTSRLSDAGKTSQKAPSKRTNESKSTEEDGSMSTEIQDDFKVSKGPPKIDIDLLSEKPTDQLADKISVSEVSSSTGSVITAEKTLLATEHGTDTAQNLTIVKNNEEKESSDDLVSKISFPSSDKIAREKCSDTSVQKSSADSNTLPVFTGVTEKDRESMESKDGVASCSKMMKTVHESVMEDGASEACAATIQEKGSCEETSLGDVTEDPRTTTSEETGNTARFPSEISKYSVSSSSEKAADVTGKSDVSVAEEPSHTVRDNAVITEGQSQTPVTTTSNNELLTAKAKTQNTENENTLSKNQSALSTDNNPQSEETKVKGANVSKVVNEELTTVSGIEITEKHDYKPDFMQPEVVEQECIDNPPLLSSPTSGKTTDKRIQPEGKGETDIQINAEENPKGIGPATANDEVTDKCVSPEMKDETEIAENLKDETTGSTTSDETADKCLEPDVCESKNEDNPEDKTTRPTTSDETTEKRIELETKGETEGLEEKTSKPTTASDENTDKCVPPENKDETEIGENSEDNTRRRTTSDETTEKHIEPETEDLEEKTSKPMTASDETTDKCRSQETKDEKGIAENSENNTNRPTMSDETTEKCIEPETEDLEEKTSKPMTASDETTDKRVAPETKDETEIAENLEDKTNRLTTTDETAEKHTEPETEDLEEKTSKPTTASDETTDKRVAPETMGETDVDVETENLKEKITRPTNDNDQEVDATEEHSIEKSEDAVCNGEGHSEPQKIEKEDDQDSEEVVQVKKAIPRKKGRRKRGRASAKRKRSQSTVQKRTEGSTRQAPRQKKPKLSRLEQLKVEAESILHMGEKKSKDGEDAYRTRSGRRVKNAKKEEPEVWQTLGDDDSSARKRKDSEGDDEFQYVEKKKGRNQTPVKESPAKHTKRAVKDDVPCMKCGLSTHPEMILLCDDCDKGHHMACLKPPLMIIPYEEWFCPKCSKDKLIAKLKDIYNDLETKTKLNERKTRQSEYKKLLNEYTGISSTNIIPGQTKPEREKPAPKKRKPSFSSNSESDNLIEEDSYSSPSSPEIKPTRRCRTKVSYDFTTFDKTIMDAIKDDIDIKSDDAGEKPISGKDIRTIIAAEKGEDAEELIEVKEGVAPARRKKRKLTNLNSSEDEAAESGSNYSVSESEEEMSEEEFQASNNTGSEESLSDERRTRSFKGRKKPYVKPVKRSKRLRRKRIQEEFETSPSESSTDYEDEVPSKKKAKRRSKWNGYGRESSEDEYVPPRIVRDRKFINDDDEEEIVEETKRPKKNRVMNSSSDEGGAEPEKGKAHHPKEVVESSDDWSSLSSNAVESSDEGSISETDSLKHQRSTAKT